MNKNFIYSIIGLSMFCIMLSCHADAITDKIEETINFSSSINEQEQALYWPQHSLCFLRYKNSAIDFSYSLMSAYFQEPELMQFCSYMPIKCFVVGISKIYYDKGNGLIIGIGCKPDWDSRHEDEKYFMLFMKSLKIDFFQTEKELQKMLNKMNYREKLEFIDPAVLFNEIRKNAVNID